MVLQCKLDFFTHMILPYMEQRNKVPMVVEDKGGYIECFDRDWVFIQFGSHEEYHEELVSELAGYDVPFIIGQPEWNVLIQQQAADADQFIFLHKDGITWAASSYIKFVDRGVDNHDIN